MRLLDPVRRLRDFYLIQLDLVMRWRPGRRALARRTGVSFVVSLVALWLMAVVPGIHIRDAQSAALAVLVFWALNLLLRPVILAVLAPIATALVVLASLAFQVLAVSLLSPLVPGVQIDGVGSAILGSCIFAIANTALTAVFSISDDDSHYGALVRRLRMQRGDAIHTTDPGVVVIQIDGLSHDVLKQQLHAGRAPTMSRMIREGSHRLTGWETLLPSQTSASQAGILHGDNDRIPAFRWWDKELGRLLVSNHPRDAAAIMGRISNGRGLLSPGGASINNLASGDAARSYLTMATLGRPGGGLGDSRAFEWFFVSPYNYLHTIVRFFGEAIKELVQAWRQRRAGMSPIINRGFPYPFVRATTNVVLRALGTSLILEEMYRGTPVIYADFTDYDEIAHHSGPERSDALDALDGVDRVIGTLQKAAEDAARPYRIVVLSDHGQTLGATFRQRFGVTLEQVVHDLLGAPMQMEAATTRAEEYGPINAFVAELRRSGGLTGAMARAATRSRGDAAFGPGARDLGPTDGATPTENAAPTDDLAPTDGFAATADTGPRPVAAAPTVQLPEVVVCASGNLGLISFPRLTGRVTLEALETEHPRLIEALAGHPGIGFVLVRTEARGAICVGGQGLHFLDDDSIQGSDPLAAYGDHAAASVRRVDGMPDCPDILAISVYDADADEIAAFEELIGSHGGLGGAQTRPFLLTPAGWPLDDAPLLGAPAIYGRLRSWFETELGIPYAPDPPDVSAAIESVASAPSGPSAVPSAPAAASSVPPVAPVSG